MLENFFNSDKCKNIFKFGHRVANYLFWYWGINVLISFTTDQLIIKMIICFEQLRKRSGSAH